MATIGATTPTLADVAKRMDPDGSIATVAELLAQDNHIIQDMPFYEGNLPTGHQYTVRTGLPTVYWRQLNQGVPTSKSRTAQAKEQAGIMEARSVVDVDLALLNGNTAQFRLSETKPFLESMAQEFASTVFYGNAGTAPAEFTGLSTRFSSLSADNAQNVVDAGGTGSDNLSIWLVNWGEGRIHGIFPKGSKAGLQHKDLGEDDVQDADGNEFRALKDWFQWKAGLAMPDWRHVVRICNIDVSTLVAQSGQPSITDNLIKAIHRIKSAEGARLYMNRTAMQYLEIEQRKDVRTGGQLSYSVVDGKPVTSFRTVPIRICDALLETEARVT